MENEYYFLLKKSFVFSVFTSRINILRNLVNLLLIKKNLRKMCRNVYR